MPKQVHARQAPFAGQIPDEEDLELHISQIHVKPVYDAADTSWALLPTQESQLHQKDHAR